MTRVSKKLFKPWIKQVLLDTPNIEHGTKKLWKLYFTLQDDPFKE